MKLIAIFALAAVVFAAFYAGHAAVRGWRASVAVRIVRMREAE